MDRAAPCRVRARCAAVCPLCPVSAVWYNLDVALRRPEVRTRERMIATVARISYVKRFKMEMDLRELPASAPLQDGHAWVPCDTTVLEAHADMLYLSFRSEIDAAVFPSFGDRAGCTCLMTEMNRKPGFLPASTWLLSGPDGYIGSVQGLRECGGFGAIQNLGVVSRARGRGFGTALLLQSLHRLRTARPPRRQ